MDYIQEKERELFTSGGRLRLCLRGATEPLAETKDQGFTYGEPHEREPSCCHLAGALGKNEAGFCLPAKTAPAGARSGHGGDATPNVSFYQ